MSDIVLTDPEPVAVKSKPLNQKQLEALVFNLAVQADLDGNAVFYKLRREYGQTDLQRKPVEQLADQMRSAWETAPPLVRAKMRLDAAEISLTGDVMEVLGNLDLENPADVRDAFQFMRDLNQHSGAQLANTLDLAIDFLAEAGADVAELRDRYTILFPKERTDA